MFESTETRNLGGKSLESTSGAGYVTIFRARNTKGITFENGDYVTLSPKFAIEHAESNAVYEEEPQIVIRKFVNKRYVVEASNPGEYFYVGPAVSGDIAYKTLGEDYEGVIPNIAHTRLKL